MVALYKGAVKDLKSNGLKEQKGSKNQRLVEYTKKAG